MYISFLICIAYTSQSNRRNLINEIIEEEDEDKNNNNIIIKERDIKRDKEKENINLKNSNDKFRKIITKNVGEINNIKLINKSNKSNNNEDDKIKKPTWSTSHFNKKNNTYENAFDKNTFDKYIPVKDKLIPENKNTTRGIILPNLKNINNSNNSNNKNNLSNYHNIDLKKSFASQKMNLRSLSTDKAKLQQQNININSMTNDTSAFTNSSKKYFSPLVLGNQNYTEELSNFRMGLLSAGSSSNNNIIIPMIPIRRPASNFNFCGGQIWNNLENNNINNIKTDDNINSNKKTNNNNININKKEKEKETEFNNNNNKEELNNLFNKPTGYSRNKSVKGQSLRPPIDSLSIKKDVSNYYLGMDKMINKLHKIKIEKGMMNSGIMTNLNKKINNDYQTQIEQFKKSHLPMMFNNQKQNNKNNINSNSNYNNDNNKRSHSTSNKNKIC